MGVATLPCCFTQDGKDHLISVKQLNRVTRVISGHDRGRNHEKKRIRRSLHLQTWVSWNASDKSSCNADLGMFFSPKQHHFYIRHPAKNYCLTLSLVATFSTHATHMVGKPSLVPDKASTHMQRMCALRTRKCISHKNKETSPVLLLSSKIVEI